MVVFSENIVKKIKLIQNCPPPQFFFRNRNIQFWRANSLAFKFGGPELQKHEMLLQFWSLNYLAPQIGRP